MSTITKCDECKRYSDAPSVGYIGKEWEVRKYKEVLMMIKTTQNKDLCGDCVRKIFNDNVVTKHDSRLEDDY